MNHPDLRVVDTNVAKIANLAIQPDSDSDVPLECIYACIEALKQVTDEKGLVIDAGDEIFTEYRNNLSMKGQPGVGDAFMKWVYTHQWSLPEDQRVNITKNGDSYEEFPDHDNLNDFDRSDRKFVAVANAHPSKPAIVEATDSKWWGWKDALSECGICVQYVCEEYIKATYQKKMGE